MLETIRCRRRLCAADGIEQEFRLAIDRGELDVEYQPFVDRTGKQVLGVEALRPLEQRWDGQCAALGVRADRRTDRVH